MAQAALINYLTTIRFGAGAIADLEEDLRGTGITRPLIITDPGLAESGLVDRLPGAAKYEVFSGTPSNPTEAAARAALKLYRSEACDGLIGFGGGSPIDLAKCVALMATHEPRLQPYAFIDGGLSRITNKVAPVIAVPTTAGTGAEVGRAALVTLDDGRKVGIISPHMIPRRAICDPELTTGMPAWLTAATGMDAMSHCIETFLSPRFNPPAEAIALDGLRRITRNIERAIAELNDVAVRAEMLMGAVEGGLTFQKGLGAVHSLSHALGSLKEPSLHHGTLNAVLLPPVLRYNADACAGKYAQLAEAMGLPAGTDLADWIARLNERIGMPASLKAMGVPTSIVAEMAEKAKNDHSTLTNPRPIGVPEFTAMLEESLRG